MKWKIEREVEEIVRRDGPGIPFLSRQTLRSLALVLIESAEDVVRTGWSYEFPREDWKSRTGDDGYSLFSSQIVVSISSLSNHGVIVSISFIPKHGYNYQHLYYEVEDKTKIR